MSYRIHLTICKRENYEEFLRLHKENPEDNIFYLPDVKDKISVEISCESPIDGFNEIEDIDKDEYPPYLLNKEDFKQILIYYQDLQIELNNDRLKNVIYLRSKKYGTLKRKMGQLRRLFMVFWNYAWWSKTYFEDLKGRGLLISDSDRFEFQYFYLVGLYESFNDKTDVAIITHG